MHAGGLGGSGAGSLRARVRAGQVLGSGTLPVLEAHPALSPLCVRRRLSLSGVWVPRAQSGWVGHGPRPMRLGVPKARSRGTGDT